MAWASGGDLVGPPAYKLGVDVMKVQLPKRECFANFLDAFGDQVSQYGPKISVLTAYLLVAYPSGTPVPPPVVF